MAVAFIQCLRPKQWTKNLLIFAGLMFTGRWSDGQSIANAVAAFAIFCALSGVVYVVNDVLDAEQDRLHPKKRNRPIAAGRISPAAAGTGAYKDVVEACTATIKVVTETKPDKATHKTYQSAYPMYGKLYESLKGDFAEIAGLIEE